MNYPLIKNENQQGMTLIEVTLAIAVLTAGIVSLLMVLASALQQKEASREYQVATNAAVSKMEEIRGYASFDFSNLASHYASAAFNEWCVNCGAKHTTTAQVDDCMRTSRGSGLLPWDRTAGPYNTGFIDITATEPSLIQVGIRIRWLSVMGNSNKQEHRMYTLVARSCK
ncbi:MAG: hypothetical protein WC980_02075 [Candidatus Brocadiia bacterium]